MFVRPPDGLSISPGGEGEGELGQECLRICEDEWLAPGQVCALSSVDFEGRALRFPGGRGNFLVGQGSKEGWVQGQVLGFVQGRVGGSDLCVTDPRPEE